MNRWEELSNQFNEIGSIALTAVIVDDEVWDWKINECHGDSQKWGNKSEFFAAADEAVCQLGRDDRKEWYGHLFKTYPDQFRNPPGSIPLVYQETMDGEAVGEPHIQVERMVPDAVRLSARAARDLAEIEPEEELTGQKEAAQQNQTPIPGKSTATAVEALLGGEAKEVLDIASSDDITVDDKMRKICGVDVRFLGYNSTNWAELLGVTDAAIRQTLFWREDRKKAIEADRALSED